MEEISLTYILPDRNMMELKSLKTCQTHHSKSLVSLIMKTS